MKNKKLLYAASLACMLLMACSGKPVVESERNLKNVLGNHFLVGVAINHLQLQGQDSAALDIVKTHFNSIVPENCMKCMIIHPEENVYDFELSDRFVAFGEENGMFVVGHCLIWHSQLASWFCTDENGADVSPEVLKQRMKDHITTIVKRYKGRVHGWDVVNEAILEDGSYRNSKFYQILGEEFVPLAFQYAYEADPEAELYYNDYNMHFEGKRRAVIKLVEDLKARGIRIDAVGMQGHVGMEYPQISDFEASIEAFSKLNVKVMITEFDMSALPMVRYSANVTDTVSFEQSMNPYPNELPSRELDAWNKRMMEFMNLFVKHSRHISRVTFWGVTDGDSWKNDFPMRGRTDYPLLFDRNYEPKQFVKKLLGE